MSNLFVELFKKYGLWLIISILVASSLIWILAHFTAKQGTNVSVLWGLVEYTKQDNKSTQYNKPNVPKMTPQNISDNYSKTITNNNIDDSLKEKINDNIDITNLPAIDLLIYSDVNETNLNEMVEKLRVKRNLREITALESSKRVKDLPSSTYFFLQSTVFGQKDDDETLFDCLVVEKVRRYKLPYGSLFFETHKFDNDLHVIGYISKSHASQVARLTGSLDFNIIVAAKPALEMSTLISIPVSRILHSTTREIQLDKNQTVHVIDIILDELRIVE